MPFVSTSIPLSKEQDRRIKLSDEQREEIRRKYATGLYSQRGLAKEYGVSKSLIRFIVNPDTYKKSREQFKQRRADGRYKPTKEEWAATVREHRRYKETLYKQGKLKR